ncbi:P1 family peptidase [uncultured Cohaesibacter sp.]|uniref:P1 family peptidase n=1 Tax=uncultured Cohaesibacter sp. TaxID=1002546 RepID=UPI0029314A0E|nr:P1 family peptidase [uncultured Cohaesibacter sp.]
MKNLITDIDGILVGNASNEALKSGTTALICSHPMVASYAVLGGAPGTRETDLLMPDQTVEQIDALVLSGGSAFGLDAAGGVQGWLRDQGRGFAVGPVHVPIVPAAILFDLINGGDKAWQGQSPYWDLGWQAAAEAKSDFALGSHGAGTGALIAGLKGGLGSASMRLDNGITIGALVAVNALGQATMGSSRHFWAAPFEKNGEFGDLGLPATLPAHVSRPLTKGDAMKNGGAKNANTTIGIIATDARIGKAAARRLAIMAHDGFSRALWPSHTPMDGDLIFALSSGKKDLPNDDKAFLELGAGAAATMARAIARGIYEAQARPNDIFPTWQDKFG